VYSRARVKHAGQVLSEVPDKCNLAIHGGANVVRLRTSEPSKNSVFSKPKGHSRMGRRRSRTRKTSTIKIVGRINF
jgi:hypothetical protein